MKYNRRQYDKVRRHRTLGSMAICTVSVVNRNQDISRCQRNTLTSSLHTFPLCFCPTNFKQAWCSVSHCHQTAPVLFCMVTFLKPLILCFLVSVPRLQNIVNYVKDSPSFSFINGTTGTIYAVLICRYLHYFTFKRQLLNDVSSSTQPHPLFR